MWSWNHDCIGVMICILWTNLLHMPVMGWWLLQLLLDSISYFMEMIRGWWSVMFLSSRGEVSGPGAARDPCQVHCPRRLLPSPLLEWPSLYSPFKWPIGQHLCFQKNAVVEHNETQLAQCWQITHHQALRPLTLFPACTWRFSQPLSMRRAPSLNHLPWSQESPCEFSPAPTVKPTEVKLFPN